MAEVWLPAAIAIEELESQLAQYIEKENIPNRLGVAKSPEAFAADVVAFLRRAA